MTPLRPRRAALLSFMLLPGTVPVAAQVRTDGSLGARQTIAGPDATIPALLGRQAGANLFHSFAQFDVPAGGSATFTGPAGVHFVLARVTGGAASHVDGALRCDIGGASLYLMNPAGVVFGPGAALDVRGSFAVTTADAIHLADGGRFPAQASTRHGVLTSAPPAAFGFLSPAPAGVRVRGLLETPPGAVLTVAAGPIRIRGGRLTSAGGAVNLFAAAGPGRVDADPTGANFDPQVTTPTGDVSVTRGAAVSTDGDSGGRVTVRARDVAIDASTVSAASVNGDGAGVDLFIDGRLTIRGGGVIRTGTTGAGAAGDLIVTARDIDIDQSGGTIGTGIVASTSGPGPGGQILVGATGDIALARGGAISSSASASGAGGRIAVIAQGTLRIDRGASPLGTGIFALSRGAAPDAGAAGNVAVRASRLDLIDGGRIDGSTGGPGAGGSVRIDAGRLRVVGIGGAGPAAPVASGIVANSVQPAGQPGGGAGGALDVNARAVLLDAGGQIRAATTGDGAGGTVNLSARRRLAIYNGSTVDASTFGPGRGGDVVVTAPRITIDRGASAAAGLTGIASASGAAGGPGGNVTVVADRALRITRGGAVSAATLGDGDGGTIIVLAGDLTLDRGAGIGATSTGRGAPGAIGLVVGDLTLRAGGFVTAQATVASLARAGDIVVRARRDITIDDARTSVPPALASAAFQLDPVVSRITAESLRGAGGNVLLSAGRAVTLFNAVVTARAVGQGGQVSIDAPRVALNRSLIDGRAGRVDVTVAINPGATVLLGQSLILSEIQSLPPDIDISGSLVPLSLPLVDRRFELAQDCPTRLRLDQSSFVISGRAATPVAPGGLSPSTDPVGARP